MKYRIMGYDGSVWCELKTVNSFDELTPEEQLVVCILDSAKQEGKHK